MKQENRIKLRRVAILFLLAAVLLPPASTMSAAENYDIILRGGLVIDGTGARGYQSDIAVRNGYIVGIGNLRDARANTELDVSGLVVAPGFINLHSHATRAGVATAVNMLTQGVTTEIINADGSGSLQISRQLGDFSGQGLAVNLGAYIGFNSVWSSVVGQADRRPTADEIQKMRDLVTTGLTEGAWGVSSGLDYKPGYFARTEEVIAVLQAAAPWRTNFPNHDRLMPETNFSSLKAITETIEIGEKAGLMPVVTHMKVQGHEQGKAREAVAMMHAASGRGHETVADIYPYLAGQTGLGALFVPAWALEGGRAETLKRFADPALRPRIAREIEAAIKARILTPENIYVASHQRQFTEYMKESNAGAGETMIAILEKENPSAILKFGAEEDLKLLLQYPGTAVSCDCGASVGGPGMHPRAFGTFPRVLGHYVREAKTLTIEDAVRKMTGLPASIIGLADRGFLAFGMAADIAVFDPATIRDHANYEEPTRLSEGMRHVMVNGRIALRDGRETGEQGGRVLKRTADLPSRRMDLRKSRSLSVKVKDFDLRISQPANGKARGRIRFTDGGREYRLFNAGLLQVSGKWAGFTGLLRSIDGEEKAILVVVDGDNPMTPALRIQLNGEQAYEAKLTQRDYQINKR